MNKQILFSLSLMLTTALQAQIPLPPGAADAPAAPKTVSIQEMLVTGSPDLKLYSLSILTQGKYEGEIDESFLPGLTTCANDSALPVRSVCARLLGQNFIQDQENPNQEAVQLLMKLAKDSEADVRYNAVYYGLSHLKNKSGKILNLLIDTAATTRGIGLYERIIESFKADKEAFKPILEKRLKKGSDIAMYEIYEDLFGQTPAGSEKYLAMPSSRPRLFVFMTKGTDDEARKDELEKELKEAGIENFEVVSSTSGGNCVLMLKTYITKDYKTVQKTFAEHPSFSISQEMWLTPLMEIQIQEMQKSK